MLLALWPNYLGYFLSFVVISTFWIIHHSIFRPIRAYDRNLLYLNFLFLMFVAFVPFPTSLLGEYGDHQLPVAVYAATLAVGRLLLTAIQWYSVRNDRLLDEAQDPATVRFLPDPGSYHTGHLLAHHRHLLFQRPGCHLVVGHTHRGRRRHPPHKIVPLNPLAPYGRCQIACRRTTINSLAPYHYSPVLRGLTPTGVWV